MPNVWTSSIISIRACHHRLCFSLFYQQRLVKITSLLLPNLLASRLLIKSAVGFVKAACCDVSATVVIHWSFLSFNEAQFELSQSQPPSLSGSHGKAAADHAVSVSLGCSEPFPLPHSTQDPSGEVITLTRGCALQSQLIHIIWASGAV